MWWFSAVPMEKSNWAVVWLTGLVACRVHERHRAKVVSGTVDLCGKTSVSEDGEAC